ncbi:asparaginase [Temperatibacter marinus]|uniref:Asparaginase n=1 Tax=Temperatibacter marinus TaxID=1456591 RepID=A0AA52EFT6_9PROT|nr:asparaginase [Temperatibacter marinus]WND02035.1 asparaginase [Temperatibacter marinus]
MKHKPLIDIFALGGTIAMSADPGASEGVKPILSADDLISAIPGITDIADIRTKQVANVGSANLSYQDIAKLITMAKDSDADGFVVTQGTDTMEETSFLAGLYWPISKPLVFTGAMRNPSSPGADGPANLSDAIRVAASDKSGVYLVMNGEIHDPCRVRKSHTSNLSAFRSDGGELGVITESEAHFNQSLSRFAVLDLPKELPPVAHMMCVFDQDPLILDGFVKAGFKGLVVEAFGGGHVSEAWHDALASLAHDMPVILSARPGGGRVLKKTYGYKGAEIGLIEAGLVPSGRLNGMKARLLLQTALAAGLNWRQLFKEYADLW